MKVKIIVAGHGHFATGLGSALDLIMGVPEHVTLIDFPDGDHLVHLEEQFDKAIADGKDSEIIILTDLFSGSPFNVAMKKALKNPHLHLFYGVNLGMLMEIVSRSMFSDDVRQITDAIVLKAKEQIGEFHPDALLEEDDEEEDEQL